MGKLGVGVGEEFPVDDPKPDEAPQGARPQDCPEGCADWHERKEAWRRWREEARKGRGLSRHWHHHYTPPLWRALFIIGGIAMLIAIITHFFYFILGAAVLAVLTVIHANHYDDAMWDMHPHAPSAGE